jgi:prepilin signal peptidase PulO-like enzyme (type II secretory pathway)
VNTILSIPFAYRLAALASVGVIAGNLINAAIHTLGWQPRRANPWSPLHPYDHGNRWLDRLPLVGWWRLRRKCEQLGARFWVRPLLVELFTAALFAGLYWWEIGQQGLIAYRPDPPPGVLPSAATLEIMHVVYLSHLVLVSFMLAASFIDIDDQVIPDAVTVPGTLLGLVLAAGYPWCLLPGHVELIPAGRGQFVEFVTFLYPSYMSLKEWPRDWGNVLTLALGLACYWAWCIALLPRLWRPSVGLRRALRYLFAHALRSDAWPTIATIAVAGTCGIGLVWWDGGERWIGLLTSLVGMAVGGGLVWAVRIVAGLTLGREAMGFGDVTLMAMIGAFLGWQVCPIIFLLSPFIGLPLLLLRSVFQGQREISFGPFLCLATLAMIVFWRPIWEHIEHLYYSGWPLGVPNPTIIPAGWFVPALLVVGIAFLAVLLGGWQIIRDSIDALKSRNKAS